MKIPTTILCIIFTLVNLTSANAAEPNPLPLKISSISPGFSSTPIPQEVIHGDIQPLSNGLDDAPSTYFDDCGLLVQAVEYKPLQR